ncbi:hypothetical protein Esi_0027_0142 [Ectocarpus siliculosus]|uniref:Uncharacterized protein n=1 Tax=Ectocarpus siliculosus TaxID=2880 RepID=D7FUG5_ECTSI|nr:hypothetical protein Esi_0027_0142 [Ectocarpus siliculosus]|eukprot:CBJ26235.1 hypothetical protein Esi_0027_0142 [Ectocarpus siliculosus]
MSTKLNKTTKETCDASVEKLMAVAHKDDEGVWVHRTKLIDLCCTDGDLTNYLLGPNAQCSPRRVAKKFKVLADFTSWPGSRCQLYSHTEDLEYSRYFILRE